MDIYRAKKKDCKGITDELWVPFMDYCSKLDDFSSLDVGAKNLFYSHLCDFVENKNNVVFVAKDSNKFIGFIKITKLSRPPVYAIKTIGEITDLFVLSEHRTNGIGRDLVQKAFDWFKSNELDLVWLRVHSPNLRGNSFWKKFGFEEYMVERIKRL